MDKLAHLLAYPILGQAPDMVMPNAGRKYFTNTFQVLCTFNIGHPKS